MSQTRTFGVTIAIRAEHVQTVAQSGGKVAVTDGLRDLAQQAMTELAVYVGGAVPRSEFAVDLKGPEDDPIQGPIYGLSVAALFQVDDLGTDCPARLLMLQEGAYGQGAVDVVRHTEGEALE